MNENDRSANVQLYRLIIFQLATDSLQQMMQTAARRTPRVEESASTQRPKLQPYPGTIPAQKPISSSSRLPDASGETETLSEFGLASAAFILNQNNAVCLPLVSDSQKLIWVYSNQISLQLDDVAELDKAFATFPYLTQRETAALARRRSLHPDQVRVWFMAQRLRYGISWDCQDICEVRAKLCNSSQAQGEQRMREELREERREEKPWEGDLMEYGGERAEEVREEEQVKEERVREEKWEERRKRNKKVRHNKRVGGEMTREEGMTEEGGKREEDRKAEAVEKDKRNEKKWGRLTVTGKMMKRIKKEGEEGGLEERGTMEKKSYEVDMDGEKDAEVQTTLHRAPTKARSHGNSKTMAQMQLLRHTFLTCQFPNSGVYNQLAVLTGLPRQKLVQWFSDTRYNVKNRKPCWLKQDEHSRLSARIKHRQRMRINGTSLSVGRKPDLKGEA